VCRDKLPGTEEVIIWPRFVRISSFSFSFLLRWISCICGIITASSEGQGGVWIHQISKRHSQAPFKKIRGSVQLVLFHPLKPHFFVAVRIQSSICQCLLIMLIVDLDSAICQAVQFGGAEAGEDTNTWYKVDIMHGRSSIWRSSYCWRI